MKVLFITNVPSPYRVDFFNELGTKLDLTVLFERNNAKSRNQEWISNNFKHFKYYFLKGIKYGDDSAISFEFKKYFKKENYDVVCLVNYHTITANLIGRYCFKKKIPYYLCIDGIFKHEVENKIKLKLKKKLFSAAAGFITTGKYSEKVIEYYGGKNCYIYPFTSIFSNYVLNEPVSQEEKNNLKQELDLKKKTILFVGQFIPRKGIDILFNIYNRLENCQLVMIGGKLSEEYLKLQKELNLEIRTIEFLNSLELQKYYLASDVFVLPTREDQWGLVINEALAKGLPVVSTTRCLSCYEMLNDNGYMVDVDDVDAYVKAINSILTAKEEDYRKLQENALKIAKKYTIEKMAQRHIEIFNDILSKR